MTQTSYDMMGSGKIGEERRHIFITGGVVSSLGKGIVSASLGMLLGERGFRVTMQKFDPYLNVDPGTMNPYQHGEVFVTDDRAETDLDLGHYERFTEHKLPGSNCVTSGQIYKSIIDKERKGEFLGKTVQVIPHVTEEIKHRILENAHNDDADINIVEIGGTVGDIEGLPFLEAIRQLRLEMGRERVIFVHLTLVPFLRAASEMKTKPTQHSVRKLTEIGIQPDILVCRSEKPLGLELKKKIALFTNVPADCVIEGVDCESIYQVPLALHAEGLDDMVLSILRKESTGKIDLSQWNEMVAMILNPPTEVEIAIVGKYTHLADAYKSINESLVHAGVANRTKVNIRWVESSNLEGTDPHEQLAGVNGILVPGGFGVRGIEGMVNAVQWARERNSPYFGICLGMHCMIIEFSRNVCNLENANSSEVDPTTPHPVIDLLEDQDGVPLGGTMRLGAYDCQVAKGSLLEQAYHIETISERHRHRYEFNDTYRGRLEAGGMKFTGINPERNLVETVEVPGHPWFFGCQFHPEYKSRPRRSAPLFRDFIREALKSKEADRD